EGEYTAVCGQPRGFDCRRSIDRPHQGSRANPATAAGRPPPKNISRSAATCEPILGGQKLGRIQAVQV
ncbi:Glycosyl transferase, family 2?, partial [uncultured Microcoleus sp.]